MRVVLPHQPEGLEDLALSVEPGVAGGSGATLALLVETADDVALLAAADAGAPGVSEPFNGLSLIVLVATLPCTLTASPTVAILWRSAKKHENRDNPKTARGGGCARSDGDDLFLPRAIGG